MQVHVLRFAPDEKQCPINVAKTNAETGAGHASGLLGFST